MTQKRLVLLLTIAAAVLGALIFVPSIPGGWIYDDHTLIAENQFAHSLHWWPRYWATDFWNVSEEAVRFTTRIAYWRPLISTSYAVDWRLGGGSPLMFHITNIVLQAVVGALSFALLRRWIGAIWPAFFATLLFLAHPTKAESVAWISGRTDVICMLAVLMVCHGVARRLRGAPGGLILEVFGTLIAYTSKEQAIVLPLFVAVEAWVAADRPAIDFAMVKRIIKVAAPQAVITIAYLAIRATVMPVQAVNVEGSIRAGDHVQAVLESFGRFFALTVAPHDLSIQQGLIHLSGGQPVHSVGYMVLGAVGLAALIAVILVCRRRVPYVSVGIAFYLLTLVPTSNIVYTHMETLISERFLYLPFLGIALVVGCALLQMNKRRWLVGIVVVATCIFAVQSVLRSADYANEDEFWVRELRLHPTSPIAPRNLIQKALREKKNRLALAKTLELTRTDVDYQDLAVAFDVAQLMTMLTPDHARPTLQAIDSFAADLLLPKLPEATLSTDIVTFTIPTTTRPYKKYLEFYRLRLIAMRATLRMRLGDEASALALARDALTECPRCIASVTTGATVFASTGDYEQAAKIIDVGRGYIPEQAIESVSSTIEKAREMHARVAQTTGAAQLQARAAELAALELWGRAYDVLAPYKDEIKKAPKFVRGFAELAFRAGEPAVAREMLAGTIAPAEIDRQLNEWAAVMGWTE